jgi:HEPN domain-containing protein
LPRTTESDNPGDWLLVAEADLAMVRHSLDDDVAFHACQAKLAEALEKCLKAELIRLGWRLIRTHDLQHLADELALRDAALEALVRPLCLALAEYYLGTRYPGFDLEDPDWPTLRSQLEDITALAAGIRGKLDVPPPGGA